LVLCVELAHSRDDVARQTDADDLHDGLEDEQGEVRKVRVGAVLVLEGLHVAIAGIIERLGAHGDEVRVVLRIAQSQTGEKGHRFVGGQERRPECARNLKEKRVEAVVKRLLAYLFRRTATSQSQRRLKRQLKDTPDATCSWRRSS
jgi:hypothetical protein